MDILHSLYDIVSGLGSFLLIPVFFFLLGLASRAGVQRSGQCALAVLGSTVAIQLLISTLSGQLVTLVNAHDRYLFPFHRGGQPALAESGRGDTEQ